MLTRLSIQNYAIIDELEIDFSNHLTAITGETGAGKSIIIGALGLILGERADTSVLLTLPDRQPGKEKKCVVEASFDSSHKKEITSFLHENDFDAQGELTIRREISAAGKSRAFINDTPSTLVQLSRLSSLLVDLHQQFDTLELTQNDFQREVLDALAGNAILLEEYQTVYSNWQKAVKETEELKAQKLQFDKEADYNRFQYTELEEAAFRENELEGADTEMKLLNSSEEIKNALTGVYFQLQESETPLVPQLKTLGNQLNSFATLHPSLPEVIRRLQSAQVELDDIAGDIERISDSVNYNPQRIEQLNERVSLGYKLQKKHGVHSTNELLAIQKQLAEKLQAVLDIDDAIQQKETLLVKMHQQASQLALKISDNRQKQAKPFEDKVNKLLAQVGMPNAKLKADIKKTDLNSSGSDNIEFLFNANLPAGQAGKSGQFQPVRKVASGGELSRLMLCIKSLVAQSMNLPTLIFDEIDTGISGEAARQVGIIMKLLAAKRQVICITHQPQIAGKADAHLFVYKEIKNDKPDSYRVKTNIRLLNTEERITTIAKMLSGEKPTAAALENAREMVRN
jgi:DNA repair protein RecN (Recombination protein N)